MTLQAGQQLADGQNASYVITRLLRRSGTSLLYEAEKLFFNFRYAEGATYPAGPDERLPVYVRTYDPGDHGRAALLRDLLRFEGTTVLTLADSRWFPEPIDFLDAHADTDRDATTSVDVPCLVMERPGGTDVATWCGEVAAGSRRGLARRLRVARECHEIVECLHRHDLLLGAFDPAEILLDRTGRLCYLGGDRVIPARQVPRWRACLPPERFPAGLSHPQLQDPHGWLDRRSDLYSWAALCVWLLTGQTPAETDWPAKVRNSLEAAGRETPTSLQNVGFVAGHRSEDWPKVWLSYFEECLRIGA